MKLRRHTDLRAALIRVWLTAGIAACLAAPAAKAAPTISATPNPVIVAFGETQGDTTVTWDAGADHMSAQVRVSVDGGAETPWASIYKGQQTASIEIGKTYTFRLYDSITKVYLGASVTVTAKYNPLRPPFFHKVAPEEHGTYVTIGFTTDESCLPVVSASTKKPLSFPAISTKDEKMWSNPGDIASSNFAQTGTTHHAQLNKLKPDTLYHYVISAHDKKSGRWFKKNGTFKTLRRAVTVRFKKLWITDDSDSSGDGELRFGFYINGKPVAKYPSGSGYSSLGTDEQETIDRNVFFIPAPSTLTLKATGFDNDNVLFGGSADTTGAGWPADDPNLGTGEGENGEWTSTSQTINVDNTEPEDTVGPTFFKLVAKEAHDSDLEFEVHGEYTISYAR
jgi:Purple acid Phosphatase, N-terminal domain